MNNFWYPPQCFDDRGHGTVWCPSYNIWTVSWELDQLHTITEPPDEGGRTKPKWKPCKPESPPTGVTYRMGDRPRTARMPWKTSDLGRSRRVRGHRYQKLYLVPKTRKVTAFWLTPIFFSILSKNHWFLRWPGACGWSPNLVIFEICDFLKIPPPICAMAHNSMQRFLRATEIAQELREGWEYT